MATLPPNPDPSCSHADWIPSLEGRPGTYHCNDCGCAGVARGGTIHPVSITVDRERMPVPGRLGADVRGERVPVLEERLAGYGRRR